MNYIDVLQLAIKKGHKPFFLVNEPNEEIGNTDKEIALEYQLMELGRVQKWLRDTHKIFISVHSDMILSKNEMVFNTSFLFKKKRWYLNKNKFPNPVFNTYEAALLEGIKAALELI